MPMGSQSYRAPLGPGRPITTVDSLGRGLRELYRRGEFTDVKLLCAEQTFLADDFKNKLFELHRAQPEEWTIEKLAKTYHLKEPRVPLGMISPPFRFLPLPDSRANHPPAI